MSPKSTNYSLLQLRGSLVAPALPERGISSRTVVELVINLALLFRTVLHGHIRRALLLTLVALSITCEINALHAKPTPVESILLADVFLINPSDGSVGAKVYGNFTVKEVTGASSYSLELSTTASFTTKIVLTSTTTLIKREGLQYSTTYYARVKTDLSGEYGKTTTFTTRTAEEDAFVVTPANGSSNVEAIDLSVTANKVLGASSYTIQLSKSPDFSSGVLSKSTLLGIRTVTFEKLNYLTKYYARVKTDISSFGITTSFTTRAEEIVYVLPSQPSPVGHDPHMMTLTIDKMRGASSYTLQLSATADFSTHVPIQKLSTDQFSFVFKYLEYSTTYYARAKSNISTSFGPVISFTTRGPISQRRLWGTTEKGGPTGKGTLFSYSLDSSKFTKHYDLPAQPAWWGALAQDPEGFYCLIGNQMLHYNYTGEVELSAAKYEVGAIMLATNNHLYVTTRDTDYKKAFIYRVLADEINRDPQTIYTFPTRGFEPFFALTLATDRNFYGTTYSRGEFNAGTVYRIESDGSEYTTLHNFTPTEGWGPRCVIDGRDGFVYGMTATAGLGNGGTIFKCRYDGTEFTKLHDFYDATGSSPNGKLVKIGNVLYGVTFWGGTSSYNGVIFRINTDGTGYKTLKNFDSTSGANSIQGLAVGENGMLYGMTKQGGLYGQGVLFQIKNDATNFKVLVNFNNDTGYSPSGDVLFLEDMLPPSSATAEVQAAQVSGLTFWPNPFQTSLSAKLIAEDEKDVYLTILDFDGNKLAETLVNGSEEKIIGDTLPSGVYILQVRKGDKIWNHRLVKK
jgi:uncharacterized repeat protein (TIGR03803 family)